MDIPVGFKLSQYKDPEKKKVKKQSGFHGSCQPRVLITAPFAFFVCLNMARQESLRSKRCTTSFLWSWLAWSSWAIFVVCLSYACVTFLYQTENKQKVLIKFHIQKNRCRFTKIMWHDFVGQNFTRWWFQTFFMFTPKIGEDDPILTNIFFQRGGSTTNKLTWKLQITLLERKMKWSDLNQICMIMFTIRLHQQSLSSPLSPHGESRGWSLELLGQRWGLPLWMSAVSNEKKGPWLFGV